MERPYKILDIGTLQNYPKVATLGSSLLLNDNFGNIVDFNHASDIISGSIKLSTTMILFFCLEGEVTLVIGTETYTMRKNDVQFTKSGSFGKVINMSKSVKFFMTVIDEKFYYPIFSSIDLSALQKRLSLYPICTLPERSVAECTILYTQMKQRLNMHLEDELQEQIIKGYLQALIFNVYSQYLMTNNETESRKPQFNRQQELFTNFMELLQKDYMKERNIKYYASKLCVTPRYLSRIIHEVSGLFASDHIDYFVIAEAKQLLRCKKYTVLQVSEMLNFTSQSFFGRYFKNYTGYTPKQYQELE